MSKEKTTGISEKRTQEKGSPPSGGSLSELHQIAGGEHPALITNQGVAISDNQNSLRTHPRGPTLLEDFILREKITHFDQERIPERIVHASNGRTSAPVLELAASPALQLIGKMKDAHMGRAVGILIADGSDNAAIKNIRKAAIDAGAAVKIVAPKVGGAKFADSSMLAADGQLASMPSVLFDSVVVILSEEGAKALSMESTAIDFVRDAFGHFKAITVDKGGRALLKTANVGQDAGVVDANDKDAFIAVAKTLQWDREKSVRTLA